MRHDQTTATFISGPVRRSRFRVPGTPILMYHGLLRFEAPAPAGDGRFWVLERDFQAQLLQIEALSRKTVLLEDFVGKRPGSPELDFQVLLTFDDGHQSDYSSAFPALAQASMRGVFFLNSSTVGTHGFLTWGEIREMQRGGMSFQSHGHEHMDYRQLRARELKRQLLDSKHILEDHLGRPVEFFAAPHGLVNRQVVEKAREVGYRAVCGTRSLPAHPQDKVLRRVCVYRETTPGEFHQLLECSPAVYGRRAFDWLLYTPVRIVRKYSWARRVGRAVWRSRNAQARP
jgi:peptidoglycan/xylan/chitin deacetylase (PgdA/CDA1 family)